MKFSELKTAMREFNKKHGIERKVCEKYTEDGRLIVMRGRVIISNSEFVHEFPVKDRTYVFDNYNKALTSGDSGYSIFALGENDNDCLRLERMGDASIEFAEIKEIVE